MEFSILLFCLKSKHNSPRPALLSYLLLVSFGKTKEAHTKPSRNSY